MLERRIRENAGCPSLREQKGYRAIVLLMGVTTHLGAQKELRTGGRVAGSTEEEGMLARDALTNNPQGLLETGEPVAVKAARRVREGAIGAGPTLAGTSPVAYFIKICETIFSSGLIASEPVYRLLRILLSARSLQVLSDRNLFLQISR